MLKAIVSETFFVCMRSFDKNGMLCSVYSFQKWMFELKNEINYLK